MNKDEFDTLIRTRRCMAVQSVILGFILVCALLAQPQIQPSFGHALYAAGYREVIGKGPLFFDPNAPREQRIMKGHFNPNAARASGERWVFPFQAKGPMVGPEGISSDGLREALDAGCLANVAALLPPSYTTTPLDAEDAEWVASGRGSSIWNDMCAGVSLPPRSCPDGTCGPGETHSTCPADCPAPSSTGEPCQPCPACPECPPVRPCDPCTACQPCPEPLPCPPTPTPLVCPSPPARCLDAIDALQTRVLPLGPGLRAGMRSCGAYFRELAASGCVQ